VASWEASGREAYRRLLLSEGIEAGEEVKESEKQSQDVRHPNNALMPKLFFYNGFGMETGPGMEMEE